MPRCIAFVWLFSQILCTVSYAQSVPTVPFDLEFAGVTVHLTAASQQRLQQELNRVYANRPALQRDIDMMHQLTPLLQPLFLENQIPGDFCYALLPTGEAGPTGSLFWHLGFAQHPNLNLRVDSSIDERKHPVVASEAVLPYLNQLWLKNGNWLKALLMYLAPSASETTKLLKTDPTYLLLDPNSPQPVWSILARKLAFEREEPVYHPAQPYVLINYTYGEGKTLAQIANTLRIDIHRFEPYNEWLETDRIPAGKKYPVLIRATPDEYPALKNKTETTDTNPEEPAVATLTDLGFPLLKKNPQQLAGLRTPAVLYTINDRKGIQAQPCDNAITLSYYGKVKIKAFIKYNELSEQDVVRPGEIYYLQLKAKRAKVPFHVVRRGQTLRDVSYTYGVRLESLLRYNRMEPTQRIQTGRILWLQKKRPHDRQPEYQIDSPGKVPVELAIESAAGDSVQQAPLSVPANTSLNQSKTDLIVGNVVKTPVIQDDSVLRKATVREESTDWDTTQIETGKLKMHRVTQGETYYSLAKLYGVTVQQLYDWNNLSAARPLHVGQQVIVDTSKPRSVAKITKPVPVASKPKPKNGSLLNQFTVETTPVGNVYYHVVQVGETIYRIALNNKVNVANLMHWNGLQNFTIEVGQRLLIKKNNPLRR